MAPIIDFFKEEEEQSYAALVDNSLVVSLPKAETPVVWRVDFHDIKSALFSIEKKAKAYQLVMQDKGKSKKEVIATFSQEEEAKHAYSLVSRALLGKKISQESNGSLFQTFIIFVVFFILLYWVMDSLFFGESVTQEDRQNVTVTQTQQNKDVTPTVPDDVKKGVPLSVDDLLNK